MFIAGASESIIERVAAVRRDLHAESVGDRTIARVVGIRAVLLRKSGCDGPDCEEGVLYGHVIKEVICYSPDFGY